MIVSAAVYRNRLLEALSHVEYARLSFEAKLIELPAGFMMYSADRPQTHAYFPVDSLISIQSVVMNGGVGETAIVGNEGMVGVSIFMGGDSTPGRAVVKSGGLGYQVKAQVLRNEFNRRGLLMQLLLRYTQAFLTQISQTAVCTRHHSIDQQLCRCLLLSLDSAQVSEFSMTHERIANFLGVRREGISVSAGRLKKAGLIRYYRGHISVIHRTGLEERCCECYSVIRGEYRRLLPQKVQKNTNHGLSQDRSKAVRAQEDPSPRP